MKNTVKRLRKNFLEQAGKLQTDLDEVILPNRHDYSGFSQWVRTTSNWFG